MKKIQTISIRDEIRKSLLIFIKNMHESGEVKFPSEIAMAKDLGVSRIALREVIKQFEQDGLIFSVHGRGTFLNKESMKMKVRLTPAVEFEQAIRDSGYKATVTLVSVSTGFPPEALATSLSMSQLEKVVTAKKVFLADGKPVIFCEDLFPLSLLGEQELVEKELTVSTFEYLLEKAGIIIVHDIAEILASSTNRLKGFDQCCLEKGKPLLLIRSVYYTAKHKPVMYVNAYMDTEYIKLSMLRRQDVYQ